MTAAREDVEGKIIPAVPTDTNTKGSSLQTGPSGAMLENTGARVRQVVAWLRSAELQESVGEDGIALVLSHGGFLGMLVAELIGVGADMAFQTGLASPSWPNTGECQNSCL